MDSKSQKLTLIGPKQPIKDINDVDDGIEREDGIEGDTEVDEVDETVAVLEFQFIYTMFAWR